MSTCRFLERSFSLLSFYISIFDFICFPGRVMYATAIQIRRDAIKMAERYRAKKHLFFQIQGIKNLTIPQNEIAASAIYPTGSNFRGAFSFSMVVVHFSTPLFTVSYIQQQENPKSIFSLTLYFFLHKIADVINAATEILANFHKNSH